MRQKSCPKKGHPLGFWAFRFRILAETVLKNNKISAKILRNADVLLQRVSSLKLPPWKFSGIAVEHLPIPSTQINTNSRVFWIESFTVGAVFDSWLSQTRKKRGLTSPKTKMDIPKMTPCLKGGYIKKKASFLVSMLNFHGV